MDKKRKYVRKHIQVSQPNGNSTLLLTKDYEDNDEVYQAEVFMQGEDCENLFIELDRLKTSWDQGSMRHLFKTFLHARDYILGDYFL